MFSKVRFELREIQNAIFDLANAARIATDVLRESAEGGADPKRIAALEGAIEALRGEIAAGVTKADALKATARSAEDRARGHMKRAEAALELAQRIEGSEDTDPFEQAGRDWQSLHGQGNDVEGGVVPAVPRGVEQAEPGRISAREAKRRT